MEFQQHPNNRKNVTIEQFIEKPMQMLHFPSLALALACCFPVVHHAIPTGFRLYSEFLSPGLTSGLLIFHA